MNQINVIAAGIFGAIATAFAYMFDFYPIWVALAFLLLAHVAFVYTRFGRYTCAVGSNEEGTRWAERAAELGAIPDKEMERRRRALMRIQRSISRKKMKAMVGRELAVLVEGPSEESEFLFAGRHEGQAPEIDGGVFLALGDGVKPPRQGEVVAARVTGYADYDLAATIEQTIAPTRMKRAPTRLPVISV